MPTDLPDTRHADVFVGDSDMARLMRAHDWSATPLGDPGGWPHALKVALRILLTSRFEMWIGWGPDLLFFYNDAYRPTLGIKHPQSLAQPTRLLWAEIWDDLRDRMDRVYNHGESTWDRALPLLLERSGFPEETYHTFSYSPIIGDSGAVEGLFCAVSEETDRVISERRLAALRELAEGLSSADAAPLVWNAVSTVLARATKDLPFALFYTFDAQGNARLDARSGIAADHPLAAASIVRGAQVSWGMQRILEGEEHVLTPVDAALSPPTGAWDRAPAQALTVPLAAQGAARPRGFMVVALNPFRPVGDDYLSFVRLLAGQVASGLAGAEAFDAQRQRAAELAEAVRLRHEAAETLRLANVQLAAEVQARTAERDGLRELFHQAPGFMCVLRGPDHVFDLVNESYLQLIGHRDVAGKSLAKALPEVRAQGFVALLDSVYAGGKPYVGRGVRVMLQRTPGAELDERFVNFVYQPIRGAGGEVIGVFAEGHDVTDQFRVEQELKTLNETLEARIGERTQELGDALVRLQAEAAQRESAQEALRQSQKMEAVGQLTGGIAHDFNNLLQGITGSLELLKLRIQLGRMDNVDKLIGGAMNSAQRAAGLTHRLLAFSRRQPLAPKPVKANQLIASMDDLLRRTLGEQVQPEFVLSGGLWSTLCDPNQLEAAILNLCINARDAMPHGGRLTVETGNAHLDHHYTAKEQDVQPGQYVCISVTDTGEGMAPAILARAFEPFFTTKPIGQGTGLGLSMVYGFARQSQGHVRLYSEPGHGTTAKLYLPRHRGDDAQPEAEADAAGTQGQGDGEVVLVVEDEPVVRALVVEALEELGYRTLEAPDGAVALQVLQSPRRIDLLVTDVGLPKVNGRQVADAARLARPNLKVLFMTGYAENAALSSGFLEPGMEMITKPFAMDKLAGRIQQMLER